MFMGIYDDDLSEAVVTRVKVDDSKITVELMLEVAKTKYTRVLLYWAEREYLQAKRLLNATSHFLISHIVGHLLEFIKISLGPPILKIDNFT